jgi:hypothetical protein
MFMFMSLVLGLQFLTLLTVLHGRSLGLEFKGVYGSFSLHTCIYVYEANVYLAFLSNGIFCVNPYES